MLTLQSPAFHDHGPLPARYSCDGSEVSPPLRWTGLPAGTISLALVMEDEDAGDTTLARPIGVHWVAFNLPPELEYLVEGADVAGLSDVAGVGLNDRQGLGYLPPCPGLGRHSFVFRLFALDDVLRGLHTPRRFHLDAAMNGRVLAMAELTAIFERSD
ncbi:YbhB/YbcL family Raf kinase inhibitor-like protein [Ectothiorhodospiraceae bacterium WFHF3C12]|nr:YbhB/YbcL family Raf kinase inhibitor-like protein [Ectothiorhodospiraceae bacterium WFHF3C12]